MATSHSFEAGSEPLLLSRRRLPVVDAARPTSQLATRRCHLFSHAPSRQKTGEQTPTFAGIARGYFRLSFPRLRTTFCLSYMSSSRYRSWAYLLALLLLSSCSPKPAAFLEKAQRAEAEARRAFERHDSEEADLSASRAEVALADLQFLLDSRKLAEPALLRKTRSAAASARNYAQLAHEEDLRLRKLSSLKLKAYQSLRSTICDYGLTGLAAASEQLARVGANTNSGTDQQLASFGRSLVQFMDAKLASSNQAPDWAGIASSLRLWSTNPPPAMGMALSLAYTAGGFSDFALCEIESVKPSALSKTNFLSYYHLERGALFAVHNWDRSAARELDQAIALSPEGWNGFGTTQALAVFHFWLADHALQRGHHEQADLEVESAVKYWPDSPLLGFFLAEKLASAGQWSRAADFLEAQASGVKDPWLADRFKQRAQELRETKGKVSPLFSDARFVLEFVYRIAAQKLIEAEAREKMQQWLNGAQSLGSRLAEKLPGG